MRRFVLLAALLLVTLPLRAQSLGPGAIAIVGMNADNPDAFAFVALEDLPAGAQITFTDNGWQAAGSFRANEGTLSYTVPSGGLSAGTVVALEDAGVGSMAFATAGDQVLAYQGPEDDPTFIYALNVEGDATWQASATSSNTSALPAGLANGTTAVAVDEADNVVYAGPTNETCQALLAAIGDPSNWVGDNDARQAFPQGFTVTAPCSEGGNRSPQFTRALDDREIPAEETFTFDYDASDPDGDALTYSLTEAPSGATIDQHGLFTWTPAAVDAGEGFEVIAAVSDGTFEADTSATLTVAANQAPRFTLGGGISIASVDDALILRFTFRAEDPDGDPVTFTLVDGPEEGTLETSATEAIFRFTSVPEPGVFRIEVRASDGDRAATEERGLLLQGPLFPELENQALRDALRAAYVPTLTLGYGPARDTLYSTIERTEEGAVCGVYTGYCVALPGGVDPSAYLASFDDGDASNGTSDGINAEHTWPQSKGAGEEPQRSDMHILYPAKENVNGARGNAPYAEIPDEETDAWYRLDQSQSTIPTEEIDAWSERDNENPDPGYDARFEPREQVKGDVARAAFYFYVMYQAEAQAADPNFYGAQAEHLVAWDVADPVSTDEAARSLAIAQHQGQPNPFIIDVTLGTRITGAASSAEDAGVPGMGYLVTAPYPNPARSEARLTVRVQQRQQVEVTVYDLLGRALQTVLDRALLPEAAREVELDTSRLPAGVYLVRTRGETFTATRKLVVVR